SELQCFAARPQCSIGNGSENKITPDVRKAKHEEGCNKPLEALNLTH
ncbi:uncharacterized, partial [Tachysurus ichikawai]